MLQSFMAICQQSLNKKTLSVTHKSLEWHLLAYSWHCCQLRRLVEAFIEQRQQMVVVVVVA